MSYTDAEAVRMGSDECLTPAEADGLRGRRRTHRWVGQGGFLGLMAAAVLVLQLGYLAETLIYYTFAAVVIAYGVAAFVLSARSVRCPRCRYNVFVPRDVDFSAYVNENGDGSGWEALPARCRACGVGLNPGRAGAG